MLIVFLRRRTLWGISLIAAGCLLWVGGLCWMGRSVSKTSADISLREAETILIWDAGHGGADGGAVSENGVPESGINLAIAGDCCDLCHFFGLAATMTRRDDNSLSDGEAVSIREQKVSDIKNRVSFVNAYDNAILFSIHQNSLPSNKSTHGAIVFCNTVPPASELGDSVQNILNQTVNISNEKRCREISKDIYLMAHAEHPAVLIECGFMSHVDEVAQLQNPAYQVKLACTILCGYLQYKG